MKKLSFIFITLLTVFVSIGNFGIFSLFLSQYHSEVRFNIENKTSKITDVIYINPYELYNDTKTITWEDDNNEIVYNGELYDIVSIGSEKGKVCIYAISDRKETEYKIEYAQKQDQDNGSANSPLKLLKQFFALKYIETKQFGFGSSESINFYTYQTKINSFTLNNGYQTMEIPPPNHF